MSDWIKTAKVGDRVAIRPNHRLPASGSDQTNQKLNMNSVYTIRAIQSCKRTNGLVMVGLLFEGVHNRTMLTPDGVMELDYDYRAFRPVRPTDISIFTDMLKTIPSKHTEDA